MPSGFRGRRAGTAGFLVRGQHQDPAASPPAAPARTAQTAPGRGRRPTTAEAVAGSVPGVIHAHARARWTGRTLRVEIEGWVDPDLPVRDADALGRQVASSLARQLPEASSLAWTVRAGPA
jgi:hypothetical protein